MRCMVVHCGVAGVEIGSCIGQVLASPIAVESALVTEAVSKGASLVRALSVVDLGGRFVFGNGKLVVGTVVSSESSMWTKNLISLSVLDKTVSFLAL